MLSFVSVVRLFFDFFPPPFSEETWLIYIINSHLNGAPTRWFLTARTSRFRSWRGSSWRGRSSEPATATCRSQTRRQKKVNERMWWLDKSVLILAGLWTGNTWVGFVRGPQAKFRHLSVCDRAPEKSCTDKRVMNRPHSCCSFSPHP